MASLFNRKGKLFLSVKGKTVPLGISISSKTTAEELKSGLNRAAGRLAGKLTPAQMGEFGSLLGKPASALLAMATRVSGAPRIARPATGRAPEKAKSKILSARLVSSLANRALMGNADAISRLAKNRDALAGFLASPKNMKQAQETIISRMRSMPKFSGEEGYVASYITSMLPEIFPTAEAPFEKPSDSAKWNSAIRLSMRLFFSEFIASGNPEFLKKMKEIYGSAMPGIDPKKKEDAGFFMSQIGDKPGLLGSPIDAGLFLAASTYILADRFKKDDRYREILGKMDLAVPEAETAGQLQEQKLLPLKTPVVAVIGDSITAEKIGQKIGYVAVLEKKLKEAYKGAVVDAYGVKGQATGDILGRFPGNISKRNYNTVVIQGGLNDGSSETAIKNLGRMLETARSKGLNIILLTIHPYNYPSANARRHAASINEWIKRQAGAGVGVVELPMLDGALHPGEAGRAKMAEMIFSQLNAMVAESQKKLPAIKAPKSTEEAYKIAMDVGRQLSGFIKSADPRSMAEAEQKLATKNFLSTIPDIHPAIKSNALYLASQAAFNKLKDEDPEFNRFLVSLKGSSHIPLIDLKGRPVRMHESEVGSLVIIRSSGGRKEKQTESIDNIETMMVKAMQQYLGTKYNMNTKVKGDMNALYGKSGVLGDKRVFSDNGKPGRDFFYEVAAYLWRLNPQNRFKAPGAWLQKQEQKKAVTREM